MTETRVEEPEEVSQEELERRAERDLELFKEKIRLLADGQRP